MKSEVICDRLEVICSWVAQMKEHSTSIGKVPGSSLGFAVTAFSFKLFCNNCMNIMLHF